MQSRCKLAVLAWIAACAAAVNAANSAASALKQGLRTVATRQQLPLPPGWRAAADAVHPEQTVSFKLHLKQCNLDVLERHALEV